MGVPAGYNNVIAYLVVRGADAALAFYAKAFGAIEQMRLAGPGVSVMHAEMKIGPSYVFVSDEWPGQYCQAPKGSSTAAMMIYCDDVDALYAQALGAGAAVVMPPTNMFWGDRFAKVRDPFGHEWALASQIEIVPPDEMDRRKNEFLKQHAG